VPAGLSLHLLGPEDEAALAALFAVSDLPAVTRWFDPFPLDAVTAHRLCHHTGRDLYWGVHEHDRLVGLAMVRGFDAAAEHPAFGMLVGHGHQGRGIGSGAARLALDRLRDRGVPEVRARVHDDNLGSLGMLRAAGYVELARGDGRVLLAARPGDAHGASGAAP
jgi:RimJ/RimL family protein N-acetyltransferase